MGIERYKQEQFLPADQTALDTAYQNIKDSSENRVNFPNIFDGIALFDRMGRTIDPDAPEVNKTFKTLGRDPEITQALFDEIQTAHQGGDDERVMVLIRVSHLMGHTEDPLIIKASNLLPPLYHPLRTLAGILGQNGGGKEKMDEYDRLFEEHKLQLEAKRAAAAAGARTRARAGARAGTGSRTAPSPDWAPENTAGKSTEWSAAIQYVEAKWRIISQGLPTDGSPNSTFKRFNTAFGLLHQEILGQNPPSNRSIQAMIEFFVPKIWMKPDHVGKFFTSRAAKQQTNPQTTADFDEFTQALFIPAALRTRTNPLTKVQKAELRRIYRQYSLALHEDKTKSNPDTNQDLKDYMETLFKAVTSTWAPVNTFIKT